MVRARSSNLLGKITILVMVILCVNTALALDGSGTQEDPWLIQSLEDFNDFAADANYWDDYTRLETDVNLAGQIYATAVIAPDVNDIEGWFQGTAFTGVFDGNDKRITNLTIDDGGAGKDCLGLFGCIAGEGQVSNLGIDDVSVSGDSGVGGLVGLNNAYGSISNCYSKGDVSGEERIGGLVGTNIDGSITNCYSTCDVNGVEYVGGLGGENLFGGVSNCYSTGDVSGEDWIGGLVGYSGGMSMPYGSGGVSNCYSKGIVDGTWWVGGLVGGNDGGVSNSYSTGAVSGQLGGGLMALNNGVVSNCFWDVETSGLAHSYGGTGKTTAEMQTKSTFSEAGWEFIEIWLINEGATYPVLRQEIRSDLNGDGGVDMFDFAIFAYHWLEGVE